MNFCYVEKAQKYPTLTGEYAQWSDQTITLHLHIVDRQRHDNRAREFDSMVIERQIAQRRKRRVARNNGI